MKISVSFVIVEASSELLVTIHHHYSQDVKCQQRSSLRRTQGLQIGRLDRRDCPQILFLDTFFYEQLLYVRVDWNCARLFLFVNPLVGNIDTKTFPGCITPSWISTWRTNMRIERNAIEFFHYRSADQCLLLGGATNPMLLEVRGPVSRCEKLKSGRNHAVSLHSPFTHSRTLPKAWRPERKTDGWGVSAVLSVTSHSINLNQVG